MAYPDTFKNGVNVQAIDLNNDQLSEILTAPNFNYVPEIKIFNSDGKLINVFIAYNQNFKGGVNLAAADINNDNFSEIITGPGFSGGAHLRFFNNLGINILNPKFFAYESFKGGLSVAAGDIDNDSQTEIIAAMQTISPDNKYQTNKSIEIDLSKQRLYAYYKGFKEKDFIISTGKNQFPTPRGNFSVLWKVLKTRMARNYGPDNPNNYDLPNVPHVMYFYRDYAIHGAYWHWKFGTRVSHGCVNLKLKDAKWLYEWSDVGTPVTIYSSKK